MILPVDAPGRRMIYVVETGVRSDAGLTPRTNEYFFEVDNALACIDKRLDDGRHTFVKDDGYGADMFKVTINSTEASKRQGIYFDDQSHYWYVKFRAVLTED